MTYFNGYYTFNLNIADYDSVLFNYGDYKTVDILASSFLNGNIYDISSSIKENDLYVGIYK